MSQKLPFPWREIIRCKSAVLVGKQIGENHKQSISGAVNNNPKRSIPLQVSILDDGNFLKNGLRRVIIGDGNLANAAAAHESDQETAAEIVPFGTLPKVTGAVVVIDMGRGVSELEGDEECDGNGWKYEENEEKSGGAKSHGCLLLYEMEKEGRKDYEFMGQSLCNGRNEV